jgi:hypothetical protein
MLRKGFYFLMMSSFFLFISMGNLFRLFESTLFSGNLLLSEGALYVLSLVFLFFMKVSCKALLHLGGISFCILLSYLYGGTFQGLDPHAALYALRLILLAITVYSFSSFFLIKFKGQMLPFFSFILKGYLVALVLGFMMYLFFPVSENLWRFLGDHHIVFNGDPHIGRFVSVYFDPNYYAAVIGIAFLLSAYLFTVTKKTRYQIASFLFFLSGILTWSRSGIALLIALVSYRGVQVLLKGEFSRRGYISFCFFSFVLTVCSCFYLEDIGAFLYRVGHFFEEDSALCRLETFKFGLGLLKEHPLFGIGVNFLYRYTQEGVKLNSLDSSLLALLVQVGIIPFLGLIGYGFFTGLSFFKMNKKWKEKEEVPYFFSWFCFYGLTIFGFASQFNNILFYPFWVVPFFVIFLFITRSFSYKHDLLGLPQSPLSKLS